ncbi:GNAT family N-acetyltransferase [Neosynechococcus sphagnicola]|uniref:GNAT family N-acetyltransferase n=1 Tax=Neosynechococcus sphagnicola TaxID=1501145 RepID=UPI000560C80C|nr:GNAT family N-acetyltransferase [Neosynechococcus sphagnicola]
MPIRDALLTDLPAIVSIYNAAIPGRLATADLEPVTLESRLAWFQAHSPTRHPIWVFEGTDAMASSSAHSSDEGVSMTIAGWLSFQAFYGRPAYRATAELSLYVAPQHHRQGIGRQLLEQALRSAPDLGLNILLGFIFAHNQPSLKLFKTLDFQPWGHLPGIANLDGTERDLVIVGRRITGQLWNCPCRSKDSEPLG